MKKVDLTKGKVISVIAALALPIMGSSLLQFTYNIIDMIWVGGLGSKAVASIGSSSLYVNIGNAINALVVIGTGIKVSHAVGKKSYEETKSYINSGVLINLVIGMIFGFTLIFAGNYFISFLNINDYTVEKNAYYYLVINAPIMLFSFFNMLYSRILSSFGNNKLSFRINLVGVLLNIVLDPFCIYTFNFGVVGAGVSTLIANVVMFFLFRIKSKDILSYKFNIKINHDHIKEIIYLGFPMAFQRVLFTIINILLAKIIAVFGPDAIAAQKIGVQIEAVSYMVIGGLNGAVSSFTGQNFGAKRYDRIKEGYNSSLKVGAVYALIMSAAFIIFNRLIIMMFIREESTIIIAASYLKVIAFSEVFSAIEMISNGLYSGIGKPKIPAIISIVFTAIRVPLALLLSKYFGINGVWISICISSVLKGTVSYIVYRFYIKKQLLS